MTLRDYFHLPIEAMYNTSRIPSDFHSHLDYEIYYFHSGKCTYLVGDKIYELEPGDLILMNGMTLHYPKVSSDLEYCRTIIHFNRSYAEGLLKPPFLSTDALQPFEGMNNIRISTTLEDRKLLEPLLDKLCRLYLHKDSLSHDRFLTAFMELLMQIREITDRPNVHEAPVIGLKQSNMGRIISYIENHYTEEITLDDLVHHMHLNKYYLVKLFKEMTGITLFHYIYQRRINQAKVLFTMHPDQTVTEVAYQVGFKHGSHFSQTFKKFTGIPPDEYRKHLTAAEWR